MAMALLETLSAAAAPTADAPTNRPGLHTRRRAAMPTAARPPPLRPATARPRRPGDRGGLGARRGARLPLSDAETCARRRAGRRRGGPWSMPAARRGPGRSHVGDRRVTPADVAQEGEPGALENAGHVDHGELQGHRNESEVENLNRDPVG